MQLFGDGGAADMAGRASRTSVFMPRRASTAAAARPLCPPPTKMTSVILENFQRGVAARALP